jgi:hypothetical protein
MGYQTGTASDRVSLDLNATEHGTVEWVHRGLLGSECHEG